MRADESEYAGTNLAWRLRPGTRTEKFVASPGLLGVAGGLATAATIALPFPPAAAVLGGFAALAVGGAYGRRRRRVEPPPMPGGPGGWARAARLLAESPSALEREHLFFGWEHGTDRRRPALLHDELLKMHLHVLGPTGASKTFKVAVPLARQVLRRRRDHVVYVDLKGASPDRGNAAFWVLCEEARARGLPVRYFSLTKAGHLLAMLGDPAFTALSVERQARVLCEPLAIEHGEDGSLAYFSVVNGKLVRRALASPIARGRPLSFARLVGLLDDPKFRRTLGLSKGELEHAAHGPNSLEVLTADWRMNATGDEPVDPRLFAHRVTVDQFLRGPGLTYLDLPVGADAAQARFVARFLLSLTYQRAMDWRGPRAHVHFVWDDAVEALSRAVLNPLAQMRSFGLSIWFLHQTLADLRRDGPDYSGQMTGNAAVRVTMGARDLETRALLERTSGRVLGELRGSSRGLTDSPAGRAVSQGESTHQVWEPRVDQDLINGVNADPELAFVDASPHSGFTAVTGPTVVELPFATSRDRFRLLDAWPWPAADGVHSVLPTDRPPPPPPPPPQTTPPSPPAGPGGGRKRPQKPVDPEQQKRREEFAERLRRMRRQP